MDLLAMYARSACWLAKTSEEAECIHSKCRNRI
jgi:hypothetical protein